MWVLTKWIDAIITSFTYITMENISRPLVCCCSHFEKEEILHDIIFMPVFPSYSGRAFCNLTIVLKSTQYGHWPYAMWVLSVARVFSIRMAEESTIVHCSCRGRGSRDNTFFLPRWATQSHAEPRGETQRADTGTRRTPVASKLCTLPICCPSIVSRLTTWTPWNGQCSPQHGFLVLFLKPGKHLVQRSIASKYNTKSERKNPQIIIPGHLFHDVHIKNPDFNVSEHILQLLYFVTKSHILTKIQETCWTFC